MFDFSQLNPQTAQLDLEILAAHVFDVAVIQITSQVTGFIQLAMTKRIINEHSGGQIIAADITGTDTIARYA